MKLILVYNAEDGLFNAITDTIHKVLSPSTYDCRLCYFTYGVTGMLRTWRRYLDRLSLPKEFYHRKQFRHAYPSSTDKLPAIFIDDRDELRPLVSADEMSELNNLDELMSLLSDRLGDRQNTS